MRDGRRGRAAVGQPPLPVLGALRARLGPLLLGRPRGGHRRGRGERRVSAGGCRAAPCPRRAAARAGRSRCARFELGEVERARKDDAARSARTTWSTGSRSSAASTGRTSRWPSWRSGTSTRPRNTPRAPRRTRRGSGSQLPAAIAGRTRAAVLLARRRGRRAAARAAERIGASAAIGGRAAAGRLLARPARAGRWPRPGTASGAIDVLREAESELDECGSVRVRDEMRRELRKLGARAEVRGPATAEDSGRRARSPSASSRSPS